MGIFTHDRRVDLNMLQENQFLELINSIYVTFNIKFYDWIINISDVS